ncbi:MAG: hypothetical protein V1914_02560 [archaeon]
MVKKLEGLCKTEPVGPTFNDIVKNSMTQTGAISLEKLDSFEGRYGNNGGIGCDVLEGPRSCGAWHNTKELILRYQRILSEFGNGSELAKKYLDAVSNHYLEIAKSLLSTEKEE